jgi:hypothetical protein
MTSQDFFNRVNELKLRIDLSDNDKQKQMWENQLNTLKNLDTIERIWL